MDWSPQEEAGPSQDESLLLPPASAELQELTFSMLPPGSSSGRRLGRKISHKKSASDTFAFAAGHDFLALLSERPPLAPAAAAAAAGAGHVRHASSGAGLGEGSDAGVDEQMETAGGASGDGVQQGNNSLAVTSSFTDLQAAAGEGSHIAATASTGRPGSTSDPGAAAAAAAATGSAAAAADADDAGATGGNTQTRGNALDTSQLDPRKAKRILANRQSAQRSRMKRLQYINELEGRKDRAEANLRELRAKVDSAQKHHKGLSQEVEGKAAELEALQQQLLYEQGVQESLSSYVQALQLQFQQQQQQQQVDPQQQHAQSWDPSQQLQQQANGYPVQQSVPDMWSQQGQAAGWAHGLNGTQGYCYTSQADNHYAAQQYGQQQLQMPAHSGAAQQQIQMPACTGAQDPYLQHHQQGSQHDWTAYRQQHQQHAQEQQQQHLQQQRHRPGYSQVLPSHQQYADRGHHQQQQQTANAAAHAAAAAAAIPSSAQRAGISSAAAAAAAQRHGLQPAQVPGQINQPPHSSVPAAAAAAPVATSNGVLAAATTEAAGSRRDQAPSGAAVQQPVSAAAAAAGNPVDSAAARHGSLSQGSGSVLLHGSVDDADLDSILGLGSGFEGAGFEGPVFDAEPGFEPTGSQEIRQLLQESCDSAFLLPADDLLKD